MSLETRARTAAEGLRAATPVDTESELAKLRRRSHRRSAVRLTAAAAVVASLVGGVAVARDEPDSTAPPVDHGPADQGPVDKLDPGPVVNGIRGPVMDAVLTQSVRVGSGASNLAVHPQTGDVYVTQHANDTVSVIDATAQRVTDMIAVGHEPYDIVIDPSTGLVYVANVGGAEDADEAEWTGSISVIDAGTRQVVDTIIIRDHKWPVGVAVDPSTRSLFVANNADATVSVIDTDTNEVIETVQVQRSPGSVAVNAEAGEAYVVNGNAGTVSVIDTRSLKVVDTIPQSGGPIAVDPSSGMLFIGNEGDGTVTVVDPTTREPVKTIRVGGYGPFGLEIDPEVGRAYVTGAKNGTMAVLDTSDLEVVQSLAFPPDRMAVASPDLQAATNGLYLLLADGHVGVLAR